MSNRKIGVTLASFVALWLTACDTVDVVHYEHGPSQRFYSTNDFRADELAPFTDDGVLFVVDVNQATHSGHIVWLGLYSKEPEKSVEILSASILGSSIRQIQSGNGAIALIPSGDVFRSSVKLFEPEGSALADALNEDSKLTLSVTYRIGGSTNEMRFSLVQRIERYSSFLTSV